MAEGQEDLDEAVAEEAQADLVEAAEGLEDLDEIEIAEVQDLEETVEDRVALEGTGTVGAQVLEGVREPRAKAQVLEGQTARAVVQCIMVQADQATDDAGKCF